MPYLLVTQRSLISPSIVGLDLFYYSRDLLASRYLNGPYFQVNSKTCLSIPPRNSLAHALTRSSLISPCILMRSSSICATSCASRSALAAASRRFFVAVQM